MSSDPRPNFRWFRILGTLVVCVLILAGSLYTLKVINETEPVAEPMSAVRKSAALVETLVVQRDSYRPQLVVLGTVTAAQDITLSPRVRGQVSEISSTFVPGQTVKQGDLLLKVDAADFENALAIRQSELEQTQASLKIEEGRKDLAEKELALLEDTLKATNRDLVLRVPQIASIRAEIKAAEAAVEQAKLDLKRTEIIAPFDAQILRRSVNVGSQVGPGDELARLVGVDEYWIMATVPVRSLRWMQFQEADGVSSTVTLRNPGVWPADSTREGKVSRMIGTLDPETRLAQVLITVSDPLAREHEGPSLILDTLIETEIEGRPIDNVIRLSRDYLRSRDTVWVMQDEKLEVRSPQIVFRDADYAYISEGLDSGDEVVITNLSSAAPGIGLKKVEVSAATQETSD
jgi:RND family efflux transporter MFP subunit